MVRSLILVSAMLSMLPYSERGPFAYPSLLMIAPAVAQELAPQGQAGSEADRTRSNVSVARPTWHHGAGLIYGEVTIRNNNPYPVLHVIITCDLFDEWGNQINTKGIALPRPVAPGRTRFSGIQFSVAARTTQGGACRVLSADRMDSD